MQTKALPTEITAIAPDDSEIRELIQVSGGSMVHCTLPVGARSMAVAHRTVEEVWYVISGCGQVWRKRVEQESVVDVQAGVSLSVEVGTHFQFRNTGDELLCILIATMPPWPGPDEALPVDAVW